MKKLFRRTASPEAARLLPASRLVPVPAAPRRVARRLALAIVGFLIFAGVSPWRQNVSGDGSVVAFTPDERPQAIEATISGRIVRWHVVEGQRVEEGELLVELADNDPQRLERLELQRTAYEARLEAYDDQVVAYRERLDALRQSQTAQIEA
ncbi:MAG TPA: biotin/lipoyl-binding protein, partial [Polyangiaceae bacterium LLY-WYZ-15_(1-7)]|nr:biotin/lipoyl-binding protein [Polyangiaceae bacterium LLY-WYZ-15_(1-7)]